MKTIWNSGVRKLLYVKLVQLFGPYEQWELAMFPEANAEAKEVYQKFLDSFAKIVGAKSWKAVQQQIAWATTKQLTSCGGFVITMFNNKVIAYEAGFISSSMFPSSITSEYSKEKNGIPLNDEVESDTICQT